MRIAQIAPLYERVPPLLYGGTERVVAYLTGALIDAGHDVTLFASGDSLSRARLVPGCKRALRLNPDSRDPILNHLLMADAVLPRAESSIWFTFISITSIFPAPAEPASGT